MKKPRIILLFVLLFSMFIASACSDRLNKNEYEVGSEQETFQNKGDDTSVAGDNKLSLKKLAIEKPKNLSDQFRLSKKLKGDQPEFLQTTVQVNREKKGVKLQFSITNISNKPIQLQFSSGQEFDYFIYNKNRELVYQWSEGRFFTQAIKTITLEPNDQLAYTEYWDGQTKSGTRATSGTYTVEVIIVAKVEPVDGKTVNRNELTSQAKFQLQ